VAPWQMDHSGTIKDDGHRGTSDALVTVFVMCDQSIYVLKADGDEYAST
jgi:hypothetical protein